MDVTDHSNSIHNINAMDNSNSSNMDEFGTITMEGLENDPVVGLAASLAVPSHEDPSVRAEDNPFRSSSSLVENDELGEPRYVLIIVV